MIRSILRDFTRLASFSGRQDRASFWAYLCIVVVIAMACGATVALPAVLTTFEGMQRFAAEHPDQATVVATPNSYSIQIHGDHPELMADFGGVIAGGALTLAVAVVLLAAAVARRLHDTGRPGFLGLMPLPFAATAMVFFPRLFDPFADGGEPDLGLFLALFANNMLYIGALGLLGFLVALDGTAGPNRYGPPPAPGFSFAPKW